MKNKLVLGIGIAIVLTAMLVLSIVGGMSLLGGRSESQPGNPAVTPGGVATGTTPANQSTEKIVINGRALTAKQIEEFEKLYRTKAKPGNYWYDSKSGLYGVGGQAASGFMYAGHDLGPLATDASRGNTGVFINDREQTTQEVQILSYLARTQVMPGRYWLDGLGNAGYEGNPNPVGNLFAAALAAQQQGGGSAGGDGDNFWTSRFSAGNYNSDNSAGYVSLPGGGFSSYGF